MNRKICVSLGGMSFCTCLQLASAWPLVEIRLDLVKLDPEKIETLAMQCRQWIATCRPGNHTKHDRMALLAAAIRAGAAYVDIEYEAGPGYRQALVDLAKQYRCKVIISYHNFESTPDINTLNRIIRHSKAMGAGCVKLAVTANSPADCARIMSLYSRHSGLVAFAMGEAGKITRVAAPFLGADFTFASVDEASLTAPGQLTASQMEVIYRILNENRSAT
ncbi:MAG: type I 3-dehydroquinate dehydratase [Bacteroidales bacterium]|jgi:3-dehydroquinate dehydratase type I|nr:type I 3-dehydroquinate dehydratase [Bacteroidales bacterium]